MITGSPEIEKKAGKASKKKSAAICYLRENRSPDSFMLSGPITKEGKHILQQMQNIKLRPSIQSDLEIFFQNQLDEEANLMAAFTAKDPNDKKAYMKKWIPLLSDSTVTMNTILAKDQIAGSICTYLMGEETHITYWINKDFWGKGIATKALKLFLKKYTYRPLHGSTAFDNYGSMKVLERCGFVKTGETSTFFANGRGIEIEEVFFKLEV